MSPNNRTIASKSDLEEKMSKPFEEGDGAERKLRSDGVLEDREVGRGIEGIGDGST